MMNYSENEVAPLHNEDFTKSFVGIIGSADANLDILTFVHHAISFDDADKGKNIEEIQPGIFLKCRPL
jgi:hypothetical protein